MCEVPESIIMSRVSKDPGRKAQGNSEQKESGEVMSNNLYIGLSKKQLQELMDGEMVGKRPYYQGSKKFEGWKCPSSPKYEGDLRIFIRVLSEREESKENPMAFF